MIGQFAGRPAGIAVLKPVLDLTEGNKNDRDCGEGGIHIVMMLEKMIWAKEFALRVAGASKADCQT